MSKKNKGKKNKGKKYFIIYETTNLKNKKIYVGKHWTYTPYEFDGYLGSGKAIKAAIKKYGKENFHRETLFVTEDEDLAYLKEKELVDTEFVARKDTYNLIVGGKGTGSGENSWWWGKEHKQETKDKMSESGKGKVFTEEHRKHISEVRVGTHPTEETLEKLRIAQSGENNGMWGKHHTEETKQKQRDTHSGENSWWWGKKHKQETKDKMSKSGKGRIFTEEHKRKLKLANEGANNPRFGVEVTEETRRKLSEALTGIPCANETKVKLAISHLGREVFYQRLRDIAETERIRGWVTKLAGKWGVGVSNVTRFVKKWNADALSLLDHYDKIENTYGTLE